MTDSHRLEEVGDGTFASERMLSYPAPQVFAAFAQPDLLARWWGQMASPTALRCSSSSPAGAGSL
jgi:uncharacterized protein YndB with AHSA1/START domain